jgi:hypothetical protein
MKSQRRALRRHHAARRKRWARRELSHMIDCHHGRRRLKFIGMLADTPKLCSCWMCGNPRRYFSEPTDQELRLCFGKRLCQVSIAGEHAPAGGRSSRAAEAPKRLASP